MQNLGLLRVNRIDETFATTNAVIASSTSRRISHLLQETQPSSSVSSVIATEYHRFPSGGRNRKSVCFSSSFSAGKKDSLKAVVVASSSSSNTIDGDDEEEVKIGNAASVEQKWPHIEKLCRSSQTFLDCHEEMDRPQKSQEILRLATEWGVLWRKTSHLDGGLTIENNRDNRNEITVDHSVLQNGVETVDKLAHILLDMKESDADNAQEDRGRTRPQNSGDMRKNHDIIFNIALGGWAMASPSQLNGVNASKILNRLEEIYRKSPGNANSIRPTTICYGSTIKAWAISLDTPNNNGAIEARNVLENMIDTYASGNNIWAKPNVMSFNTCLHAYALRGMVNEVEVLLRKMEKHCDTIDKQNSKTKFYLCPDVFSYTICINAYAKSTGKGQTDRAAKRADDLLQRMMKRYEKTGERRYMPNQYTFGTVISLHANSSSYKGAQNAERILQWMLGLYEKDLNSVDGKMYHATAGDALKPSAEHFLAVLFSYSNRRIRGASEKAQRLLVQMEQMYQAGNDDVKPTYQCFIVCLDILVKSGERNAAVKAEQVLDRLEDLYLNDTDSELNNYGYNLVMTAWARSGDKIAFKKAQHIMDRMHTVYNDTKNEAIRPDKISYTALMNTLINGQEHNYAEKSAALLLQMEKEFHDGNEGMKPDTIAYATVIKALGRAGKPERAEDIIKRMEELSAAGDKDINPNISCYNSLINAYAKSNRKDSSKKAEDVLRRIDEANKNKEIYLLPNIVTYTSCLDALARSGDVDRVKRAEALFERIIQDNTSNDAIPIWNVLLTVYAKSTMRNKAPRALEVIQRMKDSGCKPELLTYNILLNACSTSLATSEISSKKALEIAVEVFRILRSDDSLAPDSTTYCTLFWICHHLIKDPEEKAKTIKSTFEMCSQNGKVDQKVIYALRMTTPDTMFYRLLDKPGEHGYISMDDLPPEWSRNSNKNSRRVNWIAKGHIKHPT